jgi:hypothetical protein
MSERIYQIVVNMDHELIIAILATITAAWLSAFLGNRYATKQALKKQKRDDKSKKLACLQLLYDEFSFNQRLLWELKGYVTKGPDIEDLFAPSEVIASHFRSQAWDAVVREGIVSMVDIRNRKTLLIADRSTKDAARIVQTYIANWKRILHWKEWDVKNDSLQPSSPELLLEQALREMSQAIDYAIEMIGESLPLLPDTTLSYKK